MENTFNAGKLVKVIDNLQSPHGLCLSKTEGTVFVADGNSIKQIELENKSSVKVHCSKEFVSGLIYVAVSTVENDSNLHALGFNPEQLLQPPQEAVEEFEEEWFQMSDQGAELMEEGEEDEHPSDSLAMDEYPDGLVSSFFEKEEEKVVVDLEMVFLFLDDESQFTCLPDSLDLTKMIKQLTPDSRSDFTTVNSNSLLHWHLLWISLHQEEM
ncbi:hypothetical protein OS493_002035 [Desmophyllum pertusum]|uniref:Uncharacterized protein n=1 Tax=Desmophyllum pertusum TaxID=174260 RepID=A0A9W9Z527_9CNID|nr:hypothetical protein OS493_002035 [Desmophyllum pertusum]